MPKADGGGSKPDDFTCLSRARLHQNRRQVATSTRLDGYHPCESRPSSYPSLARYERPLLTPLDCRRENWDFPDNIDFPENLTLWDAVDYKPVRRAGQLTRDSLECSTLTALSPPCQGYYPAGDADAMEELAENVAKFRRILAKTC